MSSPFHDPLQAFFSLSFVQHAHGSHFCTCSGTSEPDTLVESCGVPVNQYFWLNTLHPTYPIHDVVAEQVSKALEAGPNVCA